MNNFNFNNPVRIIFGKDTIQEIANEIPVGNKVLILFGGGSIKKNGVYDQVIKALASFDTYEFSGIEANPHYETCMNAVALIKEKKIDFLLAVGGGSVIDATKFIAMAACFEGGDPWDVLAKHLPVSKALPFASILTLPATGSEMNTGAVITRWASKDKLAFMSDSVYPKFSVLDPTTTFTLPSKQIGNGIVDTFVHIIEQYLTIPSKAMVQDGFAESLLKTLIVEGPKAIATPNDYDVRANLMWASTWGLNGWIGVGVPQDWATHMIGHELTALYGLDHAQTLAIVLPGVMTVMKKHKAEKILQLGANVFGITNLDKDKALDQTILAVEEFFEKVGVKTHLSAYGLGLEAVASVSDRIEARGWKLGEHELITGKEVKQILNQRL